MNRNFAIGILLLILPCSQAEVHAQISPNPLGSGEYAGRSGIPAFLGAPPVSTAENLQADIAIIRRRRARRSAG